MNARPLADLIHAHAGRPALIMGGGDTLPADLARAPENCLFISANQHGCILRACDYIVSIDIFDGRKLKMPDGTERTLRSFGVPIISVRREDADIRLFEKPTANSGATAAWVAWVMGCAPILLGGMSCYIGGTYFHDPKAVSTGKAIQLSGHMGRWRKVIEVAPDGMFRAMSGPLTELFPVYDPAEPVRQHARPASIKGTAGKIVTLNKRITIGRMPVGPGEVELSDGELRYAHRHKAVEPARRAA